MLNWIAAFTAAALGASAAQDDDDASRLAPFIDQLDEAADAFDGERGPVHRADATALYWAMFSAANAVTGAYDDPLALAIETGDAEADAAGALAGALLIEALYGVSAEPGAENEDTVRVARAAVEAVIARLDVTPGQAAPYRPVTTAGQYVPTAPLVGRAATSAVPIILNARDELFPDGPPALDSEVWARDYNEVRELGRAESETRTEAQTYEARFWIAKDWEPLVEQIAARRDLSLMETARLYAMLSIAARDSGITTFAAKHHFEFWRPETAIRNGDLDGRSDTELEAGWTPLLRSPMHPEYPCAHCSYGAVVSTILHAEQPLQNGETVDVFAVDEPDEVQAISNFNEFSARMSMSRLYGGVHYRTSNEHAEQIGAGAATRVMAAFAPKAD